MAQLTDKQIERANGMNPPAREILLGDRLKNITSEGVVQVPVPDADSTANAYMEDVIGNKEDAADSTADTSSLVALVRQLLDDNGVASADSDTNLIVSDVVGNKTDAASDTTDEASIVALIRKLLDDNNVATADAATNLIASDVIGNKTDAASDTTDEASLVALARYNRKEIVEVEHHLHNYERWMGKLASPTGETDIASNTFSATTFGLFALATDASAYQWGSWVQILGSNDTPVVAGMVKFDLHRIVPNGAATDNTKDFKIQIAFGGDTDGSAALAAGDYAEFLYWENNQTQQQPIAIMTKRWAAGTKVWARAASVQSGPNTFSFWYGMHEYDE